MHVSRAAVILLLFGLLCPSQDSICAGDTIQAVEINRLLDPAESAYKKGDYTRSEKLCLQLISMRPRNAFFSFDLGVIYFAEHEYSKAAEQFQNAIEKIPKLSDPYLFHARALDQLGKTELAQIDYRKYQEFDTNPPDKLSPIANRARKDSWKLYYHAVLDPHIPLSKRLPYFLPAYELRHAHRHGSFAEPFWNTETEDFEQPLTIDYPVPGSNPQYVDPQHSGPTCTRSN
jgi:tetratricopeptide (TPR) repeat protein